MKMKMNIENRNLRFDLIERKKEKRIKISAGRRFEENERKKWENEDKKSLKNQLHKLK